jgi:hypothetical protein
MREGRRGNPDSDRDWFATDWMDTDRSQQVLAFQRHPFPDIVAEVRARVGLFRYLLCLLIPLARVFFARRSPYFRSPGVYADPWGGVKAKWGEPEPDHV